MKQHAESFALMGATESENSARVRSMIFTLAHATETLNDSIHLKILAARRAHLNSCIVTTNIHVAYSIRAKRVCRERFAGIVQMNARTVNPILVDRIFSPSIKLLDVQDKKNHSGHMSKHMLIATAFLDRYGQLHGMSRSTGHGSQD